MHQNPGSPVDHGSEDTPESPPGAVSRSARVVTGSAGFDGHTVGTVTREGAMRDVVYSMGVSLDGYIVGPDGSFDWSVPDEEVFALATDEVRRVGVYLLGRRLYETMAYWETVDQNPAHDHSTVEFAEIWRALPKVVFSSTLSEVRGNTRLASGGPAEEIARLRAGPGEGDIAVGGATLAAQVADLGLIDEFRLRVYPVLVGGGIPFFPRGERRRDLRLVESRTVGGGIVYLRYRVAR